MSDDKTRKFMLPESESHRRGTTSPPICTPAAPVLHPGRVSRSGRTTSHHCSHGADHAGGQHRPLHRDPEPVLDAYRIYRPSPLYRARGLEKELDTPAHIYYKYEGVSPAGSHNRTRRCRRLSITSRKHKRLVTETGAGQWGSALAFASAHFGWSARYLWYGQLRPETVPACID